MESATKTVPLSAGPVGYIYVRSVSSIDSTVLSLLSARSSDSDLVIAPLIGGLTVESGFSTNVAAISGVRTTGIGGSGVTLKLNPTHFHPNVFIFHGGSCIEPSSAATKLTIACEAARKRFGFSEYERPPGNDIKETTGDDICCYAERSAADTVVYLVVTELFKEAVYLSNTFLHFGGAETVNINGQEAIRMPLYPVQMFMPDVNRIAQEPFNSKFRSIGEGFCYPTPFFNEKLCRLLHGYILGTAATSLRIRNLDAVARGACHLAFDDNHEGSVLPADVTFTAFDSGSSVTSSGRSRGGARQDGATASKQSGSGFERRLASVMTADTALSVEALMNSAVYEEHLADVSEWPMLSEAGDDSRIEALGAYMARLAGIVGAMFFSTNSALYMTEVEDSGAVDGKDGSGAQSFYRFYLFAAPYLADNPQVDRDGKPVPGSANQTCPLPANGSGHEFTLDHLALTCGFCPQLLAKVLFYLERCDGGCLTSRQEMDAVKYVANSIDSDAQCKLCNKKTRATCANTTLYRLRQRLPKFGAPFRSPMGVFGAMNSNYSDCDPLGNYAAFSALRKSDGEASRSVMQDTYRVASERVTAELEKMHIINRADPSSAAGLETLIHDHSSFKSTVMNIKSIIERETEMLMRNLVETRDYKIRDGLADANHTLSLSLEPYSTGLCPVLSFMSRRTNLTVIQDMVLSQCSCVFYCQQIEAKNFRTQFQPVLRRKFMDMLNGGFMTSRTVTITLADTNVTAPDPTRPQTEPPSKEGDGDLARVSLEVLRELKIKNRVVFSAYNGGTMSEAARARVAGLVDAYQRPERRPDILCGALGFLLKQFHHVLFPNGKPPGIKNPNPQWFWTMLQRNQMPAKLLSKEDMELISFIKKFSDDYGMMNFINVIPCSVSDLAQFYMANLILKYCDHKHFYINSLTALIASARKPRDPSSVIQWIDKPICDGSEVEKAAQDVLDTIHLKPDKWTSSFSISNAVRTSMSSKPVVVLGLSISKYNGIAGGSRVFQAGNWSGLTGGKNVCPLLSFDRTRRFILACPRVGFVSKTNTFGGTAREGTLIDQVRSAMSGTLMPHISVFATVLRILGQRTQCLEHEDWFMLTEDEYLASLLCEMNAKTSEAECGWSVEAGLELAKRMEMTDDSEQTCSGDVTFDFNTCCDDSSQTANTVPQDQVQLSTTSGIGQRRQRQDDVLFDMGPVPEKRPAITLDML
ncbi:single-stranded DNA-binding protein [Spheniscid alphaherpesvirus 1]|uniref:Single-stranded DNA-binding protein n=1 Tax=Spheniscid alphaherpesvirus 1 TaxID=2560777 RepID=A0A1R3T513_9ALPH|nr:single-stranded DNA-binding protein [Spheniscid alphaherpesvirus 1]